MELTLQQQEALQSILSFANDKTKSIFILKGYAGTGKTTMIKTVVPELQQLGKDVSLMAPTGRAAKVLREKTGCEACTIHQGIYSFERLEVERYDEHGQLIENGLKEKEHGENGTDDVQFFFSIRKTKPDDPSNTIYVIDESSMISSRCANNEILHFGTGVLIDDLLTYAQPLHGGKIIFIGDPAQLPPVGDNRSAALDESFFAERQLGVSVCELKQVLRQQGESTILKDAMMVRDVLQSESRNHLCFERKKGEVEDITAGSVAASFYEENPIPSIGDAIVIAYTNALVKDYNDALRRRYFPGSKHVVTGDILQVVRNNMYIGTGNQKVILFNGDFVKVLQVSDAVEMQSAPVWGEVAGHRERLIISIGFRDAVLQTEDGSVVKCKIIDTLLNNREPNLTPLQSMALYINFRMRHTPLKQNKEAFGDTLMRDPYFNALQVKFGYAITGHKSQGGEWKTAYIDYSGRTGLNNESLRWTYTVTARASHRLYGVNMPSITPMSRLEFQAVEKYSKPAKDAFSYADVSDAGFLPEHAAAFQKQKCLCVKDQLDEKGFSLKSIHCFQYKDKYTVETPSGTVVVDCDYNGSGLYTRYFSQPVLTENEELMNIFRDDSKMRFDVNYVPSNDAFRQLYEKMRSVCDDLDITITNIVEHLQQYYVAYYLKTTGQFSQILFYFDKNKSVTYARPSSVLGMEDQKLSKLISLF